MPKNPTDLEMLQRIFDDYHETYVAAQLDPTKEDKIHVAIDFFRLGESLGCDPALLFGRIYYHLEKKYGYVKKEQTDTQPEERVVFFGLAVGQQLRCVNFPYMTSVLAQLQDEDRKYTGGRDISIAALCVSCFAVVISLFIGIGNLLKP
jgi:hypothetical protein